jgi:hypothetical protein
MTIREPLIQELEQSPDDIVQEVMEFLHQAKATRKPHPLAEFVGILSDAEAEALKKSIAANCQQVDDNNNPAQK